MKDNTISSRALSVPVTTKAPQTTRVVSEKVKIITVVVTAILLTLAASWAIYTVAFNPQDLSLTHKIIILAAGVGPFVVGLIAALVNDYCKKRVTKDTSKKIPFTPPQISKKELTTLVSAKISKVDASKNVALWNLLYNVEKSLQDPMRDRSLLIGSYVSASEDTIKDGLDVLRTLVSSTDSTDRAIVAHLRSVTQEHVRKNPTIFSNPSYNHFFRALYGPDLSSFRKEQLNLFLEQWLRYEITIEDFDNYCGGDFYRLTKEQIKKIYDRLTGYLPYKEFFDLLCTGTRWPQRINTLMTDNLFELGVPLTSLAVHPEILQRFPQVLEKYHGAIKSIDDPNTLLSFDQATILPYIIRHKLLSTAVKATLTSYLKNFNVWESTPLSDTYTKLIQPLAQKTIDKQRAHITTALAAWDAKKNELMQNALNPLIEQEKTHSAENGRIAILRQGNQDARDAARLLLNTELPRQQAQQKTKEAQYQIDREQLANEELFHKRNTEELAGLNAERMKLEAELKRREGEKKAKEADPIFNTVIRSAQNAAEQRASLLKRIAAVDSSLAGRLELMAGHLQTIEKELTSLRERLVKSRNFIKNERNKSTTRMKQFQQLTSVIDKNSTDQAAVQQAVNQREQINNAELSALERNKPFFVSESANQQRFLFEIQQLELQKSQLEQEFATVAFNEGSTTNKIASLQPSSQSAPSNEAEKKVLQDQLSSLEATSAVTFDAVPQGIVDQVQDEEEDGTQELRLRLEQVNEAIQHKRSMTSNTGFRERQEELRKRATELQAEAKRIAERIATNETRFNTMNAAFAETEQQIAAIQKQLAANREQQAQIRNNFWPSTHTKEMRADLVKRLHEEATAELIEVINGKLEITGYSLADIIRRQGERNNATPI